LKQAQQIVTLLCCLLIMIPGLALNVVNVIIFNRKAFTTNVRFFYTFQSIGDALALTIAMFVFFPIYIDKDLTIVSEFLCRFIYILRRIGTSLTPILQIMISFDRVFFTLFNSKYKSIVGVGYLLGSLSCVLILVALNASLNASFFLNERIVLVNNQTIIIRECIAPRNLGMILSLSALFTRAIIPFALMLLFNAILIYKLFIQKSQINKWSNKDHSFAVTIIAMNFLFFILNMPLSIQQLYQYWTVIGTDDHRARVRLIEWISAGCVFIFPAYTFLFHLRFNSIFRRELFKVIKVEQINTTLNTRNPSTINTSRIQKL
jgi:hypothetical protein